MSIVALDVYPRAQTSLAIASNSCAHFTMASSAIPANGICSWAYQFDITHQRYRGTTHACILRKRPTTRPICKLNTAKTSRRVLCLCGFRFVGIIGSMVRPQLDAVVAFPVDFIDFLFGLGELADTVSVWPAVIDVVVLAQTTHFFVFSFSFSLSSTSTASYSNFDLTVPLSRSLNHLVRTPTPTTHTYNFFRLFDDGALECCECVCVGDAQRRF